MADETSGGSFNGEVTVKQVGAIPVNSRVSADEETWGIPVDVNTSHRSYIKHAAMHLFAAAPLIECDDKGNIKYVPEAKVHQIAKECIKDAYILHTELHDYKGKGSGSGGSGSGGSGSDDSGLSNKTKPELIDMINDLADEKKISDKYIEMLEDIVKINSVYVDSLEKSLKDAEMKLPDKPTSSTDISDDVLPTKPTIDDVNPKPDDPDKPSEDDKKYPIAQITRN